MAFYLKSTAFTRTFKMIDSADHFSKKTGLTCTVNIAKAGGSFGAAGGTVTEIANGWYKVALSTTDTNTAGDLSFYITATGADDTDFVDQVVDPTAANLGVNVANWNNTVVGTPVTAGVPIVDWIPSGWRQNTAAAGANGSITLDASASATDNFYKYSLIVLLSSTGAGQARICTGYTGSTQVATVAPNWTTNPTSSTKFATMPLALSDIETWLATAPAALTANGNIKASLVEILTTALTETAGQLAGGFKKFFNIGTPAATMDHLILLDTVTTATTATALGAAYDAAKTAAQAGDAMALTAGERNSTADAFLNRNIAGGGSGGARNVRNALRYSRNKVDITAGTLTIYQEDDTTAAWQATVTTTAGNPITTVTPV